MVVMEIKITGVSRVDGGPLLITIRYIKSKLFIKIKITNSCE